MEKADILTRLSSILSTDETHDEKIAKVNTLMTDLEDDLGYRIILVGGRNIDHIHDEWGKLFPRDMDLIVFDDCDPALRGPFGDDTEIVDRYTKMRAEMYDSIRAIEHTDEGRFLISGDDTDGYKTTMKLDGIRGEGLVLTDFHSRFEDRMPETVYKLKRVRLEEDFLMSKMVEREDFNGRSYLSRNQAPRSVRKGKGR